jgi:hypothetical protein
MAFWLPQCHASCCWLQSADVTAGAARALFITLSEPFLVFVQHRHCIHSVERQRRTPGIVGNKIDLANLKKDVKPTLQWMR